MEKKILIVRLSALGDVVHVLPALGCLRQNFPSAKIGWLVEEGAQELLKDHPYLDNTITFPRRRWTEGLLSPRRSFSTLADIIPFFSRLRKERYDVAIDFQGNLRSGIMTLLSGAPIRVGFARGHCREGNHLFTNRHISPPADRLHKVEKNLLLLEALGIKPTYVPTPLPLHQEEEDYINGFLVVQRKTSGPLVVIHPGTSDFGAYKRWPLICYARLGDMLRQRLEARVVFSWGPSELDMVREILSRMKEEGLESPQTRTLGELASLIRHSDLFVSGDTGPMHIASLLGVPQVAIFGPKDPIIYGPYNKNSIVVRKGLECSPCTQRTCDHTTCITSITPEEVFEAARGLLTRQDRIGAKKVLTDLAGLRPFNGRPA